MSFYHTQPPHNGNLSDNYDPLDGLPQHTDDDRCDPLPVEAIDVRDSTSDDDEEARFELLSAYLDDEVTAAERQRVAQWLMDDADAQKMYQRLLMLRQAIRTTPVPTQPPLQVPSPPKKPWNSLLSWNLHRVLVCAVAIALLSTLSQLATVCGRQQLYEAWQLIKSFPQGALLELASTVNDLPVEPRHK